MGNAGTNLDTKIVGIDKDKKVFRQYNLIKENKEDLKANKITITSPDANLKLNAENTRVRLVALKKDSTLANPTPVTDEADYKVAYTNNSMEVSIILPEEKKSPNKPVGGAPAEEEKVQKTYLLIVDMPYSENSKVGATITYKGNNVDRTVENDTAVTQETSDHSLATFKNSKKDYYRPRLVNDLDFVIENIKKPDIYFKKVDEKDNTIALEGAEFKLQKKIDNAYVDINEKGEQDTVLTSKWTSTSKEKGHFGFSNIPDGDYQIVETKAPDGYALVEKIVFKFVVKNGKIEYIVDTQNNIPKNGLKFEIENNQENSDSNRILITNKKAQYPSTGGPGVWIGFTVIGMLVMFVAVLTYWKRRDKLKV